MIDYKQLRENDLECSGCLAPDSCCIICRWGAESIDRFEKKRIEDENMLLSAGE